MFPFNNLQSESLQLHWCTWQTLGALYHWESEVLQIKKSGAVQKPEQTSIWKPSTKKAHFSYFGESPIFWLILIVYFWRMSKMRVQKPGNQKFQYDRIKSENIFNFVDLVYISIWIAWTHDETNDEHILSWRNPTHASPEENSEEIWKKYHAEEKWRMQVRDYRS